jgi:RNA polymerase sigma-70 factor (ECF subfamily)
VEDQELLKLLKHNNKKAFENIFREYFHVLHEYANFYIGNSYLAEDIVQDIFLKIWDSRDRLAIHSSFKGYLFRSVHNNCIQYLRHKAVEQNHHAIHQAKLEEAILMNRLFFESGLTKLFENDIESLVNKAVDDLPEKTREIYLLSRHKYLKNSLIAKKFNITEKSVEYHITRALESLRKYLKDYLPIILISFTVILH